MEFTLHPECVVDLAGVEPASVRSFVITSTRLFHVWSLSSSRIARWTGFSPTRLTSSLLSPFEELVFGEAHVMQSQVKSLSAHIPYHNRGACVAYAAIASCSVATNALKEFLRSQPSSTACNYESASDVETGTDPLESKSISLL